MEQNIFWDKKLTQEAAAKILAVEDHERFSELAALLLSRTNDMKQVFSQFLTKEAFCRKWRQIKAEMRKNKWADERIDFWDQIHRTLYGQLGDKISTEKKKKASAVPNLQDFSEVLRNERKKQGITQKELAQKTGFSQQVISYVERGRTDFSVSTLKKISEALDILIKIVPPGSSNSVTVSYSAKD